MPMMRDTPSPLPPDMLRELRATLAPTYGHKLLMHEGRLVLAVRVTAAVPDRERDLLAAADVVPDDEVAQARDVMLIGEEKNIRLDPIPLRDLVREKLRDDQGVAKEIRRGLSRDHGAILFNPATRRDWCIAVRVPRASYREATAEDLQALQRNLDAVFQQPKAHQAGMCYIVADNDYRRCTLDEFVRTIRGEVQLKPMKVNNYQVAGDSRAARAAANVSSFSGSPFGMLMSSAAATDAKMEKIKAAKNAPAAQPAAAAAPMAAPPASSPMMAPTPMPAPAISAPGFSGLLSAAAAPAQSPGMGLRTFPPPPAANSGTAPTYASPFATPAPALPAPAPAPAPTPPMPMPAAASAPVAPSAETTLSDPLAEIGSQFTARGFEVLTDVSDLGIHLAAHQPNGKRLIVQRVAEATPETVRALAAKCAELEANAGLLVADHLAPGAWLEAAGTNVEVLPAAGLAVWSL